MKAAQIDDYGGAEKIRLREIAVPLPGPGQVLIQVLAASLNPFDTKLREGVMHDSIPLSFPYTPGGDVAGVVESIGTATTEFNVGDMVYGQASAISGGSGSLAEYALASPKQLALAPTTITMVDAATLPLVGVSALQALTEHIKLQAGQKLFINGGTGGIGTIAIQIAKHIGAYVAVTATGNGMTLASQLGADEIIDYRTDRFTDKLRDFDAVFDTVGQDFDLALRILKPGGAAVSMVATADEALASRLDVTAISQATKVTSEKLKKVASLVDAGAIKPQVSAVYPLEEVAVAFQAREHGEASGKIAIRIGI